MSVPRWGAQAPKWRLAAAKKKNQPASKLWLGPNLAVLLTHCGQLILRKICEFDATGCQILRL